MSLLLASQTAPTPTNGWRSSAATWMHSKQFEKQVSLHLMCNFVCLCKSPCCAVLLCDLGWLAVQCSFLCCATSSGRAALSAVHLGLAVRSCQLCTFVWLCSFVCCAALFAVRCFTKGDSDIGACQLWEARCMQGASYLATTVSQQPIKVCCCSTFGQPFGSLSSRIL